MPHRTYETVGWLTTASMNWLAWAQSTEIGVAASGVSLVGGALVGLWFIYQNKQLEIQKKKHELDIQYEKDRQVVMAASLSGKLESATSKIEDLTDQIKASETLLRLKDRENASLQSMLGQLEERITQSEGKKRHDAVDRITGELSRVEADAIEKDMAKDAEIAKLRKELEKTKRAVNNNADVTEKIAADSGSQEIKVAHVEDTSSDMQTLKD